MPFPYFGGRLARDFLVGTGHYLLPRFCFARMYRIVVWLGMVMENADLDFGEGGSGLGFFYIARLGQPFFYAWSFTLVFSFGALLSGYPRSCPKFFYPSRRGHLHGVSVGLLILKVHLCSRFRLFFPCCLHTYLFSLSFFIPFWLFYFLFSVLVFFFWVFVWDEIFLWKADLYGVKQRVTWGSYPTHPPALVVFVEFFLFFFFFGLGPISLVSSTG